LLMSVAKGYFFVISLKIIPLLKNEAITIVPPF
jgi:hypothetical protein